MMDETGHYDISESVKIAYKPYDVVTDKHSNVGFISEVSINSCQESVHCQLSYSVTWLVDLTHPHNSWYNHSELKVHSNIFKEIAKASVHPMGHNGAVVDLLM